MTTQTLQNIARIEANKPSSSIIFITPEMATRWLEKNTRNRKVRTKTVASYARDMDAGNWLMTGEPIQFASDDVLLNGQHRLHAIVKSGATVAIVVQRNIDPAAQSVMDTGRKRSAADDLSIKGESRSTLLAAAARLGLSVQSGGGADIGRYDATHSEIESYVRDNPNLRGACEFAAQVARKTDCPPAVVAYTYFRLSQIDTFDAARFWLAASEKVGLLAGDPVIALTNRFAESRRNREAISKRIYLSLIYRAWNARRSGKTMRFIRVNSPSGGLVPIPEPR